MIKTGEVAIQTEEAYLNRLGRTLLRYFPIGQVDELLEDYQEHFSLGRERGGTDMDQITALGTPEAVTAAILKEMPEGRSYCLRRTAIWGAVFLFACCCLLMRYTYIGHILFHRVFADLGTCFLMTLGTAAAFMLLRGRELAVVEGRFLQPSLRPGIAAYMLPAGAAAATAAMVQHLLATADSIEIAAVGLLCSAVLDAGSLVTILTAIWGLWRSYGTSIRYFPAAVHAVGALLFIRQIERFIRSMDMVSEVYLEKFISRQLVWEPLAAYCLGFFLALLFWYGIRKMMRRGGRR